MESRHPLSEWAVLMVVDKTRNHNICQGPFIEGLQHHYSISEKNLKISVLSHSSKIWT